MQKCVCSSSSTNIYTGLRSFSDDVSTDVSIVNCVHFFFLLSLHSCSCYLLFRCVRGVRYKSDTRCIVTMRNSSTPINLFQFKNVQVELCAQEMGEGLFLQIVIATPSECCHWCDTFYFGVDDDEWCRLLILPWSCCGGTKWDARHFQGNTVQVKTLVIWVTSKLACQIFTAFRSKFNLMSCVWIAYLQKREKIWLKSLEIFFKSYSVVLGGIRVDERRAQQ